MQNLAIMRFSSVVEEHSPASYHHNCSTHSLRTSDNIHNEYKFIIFSWLKLTTNSIRNKLPMTRLIYQPPVYHRETTASSLSSGNGFVAFVLLHKLDTRSQKLGANFSVITLTWQLLPYLLDIFLYMLAFASVLDMSKRVQKLKLKEVF